MAQPGIPRLRLWRDAVERSGRTTAAYERAFDAVDKYTVDTHAAARGQATPLGAIYLLRSGKPGCALEVRPLSVAVAAKALIENTYRGGVLRKIGDPAANFQACLAVSQKSPMFELVHPGTPRGSNKPSRKSKRISAQQRSCRHPGYTSAPYLGDCPIATTS